MQSYIPNCIGLWSFSLEEGDHSLIVWLGSLSLIFVSYQQTSGGTFNMSGRVK